MIHSVNIELTKYKKMLAKSEERSKKVAQANAKMLDYIKKNWIYWNAKNEISKTLYFTFYSKRLSHAIYNIVS